MTASQAEQFRLARAHGHGWKDCLSWLRSLPRKEATAILWPPDDPAPAPRFPPTEEPEP